MGTKAFGMSVLQLVAGPPTLPSPALLPRLAADHAMIAFSVNQPLNALTRA